MKLKRNLLVGVIGAALACWAGRTPLELMFGPLFKGQTGVKANSASNQFAGQTTLGSGQATVTMSTTAVNSDSLVFLQQMHVTAQASGVARTMAVRSINPGNAFVVGWSDGAAQAFDTTVMWEIKRTS